MIARDNRRELGDVQVRAAGKPGALGVGREELDDGFEVDVRLGVVHADDLRLAVGEKLFVCGRDGRLA